jgi:hypothetical protein
MAVSFRSLPVAALALLGAVAGPALAQAPGRANDPESSNRPYRGVFGSGVDQAGHSLIVTGSAGGGYDTDVLAAFRGDSTPVAASVGQTTGGPIAFGSGSIAYSLDRERIGFSAGANTSRYYYNEGGGRVLSSTGVSAAQTIQVTSGTRLSASQHANRQPFQLVGFFPAIDPSFGAPVAPPVDTFAAEDAYVNWGGAVDLTQSLGRSVALNAGYGYESSDWSASSRQVVHQSRAGVSFGLARGLDLRLGYGLGQGRYATDAEDRLVRSHLIDAGVNYRRALSFSRRTTLSFDTGSVAFRDRRDTHFRFTGHAQLDREIGRTWRASAAYSRDARYYQQLQEVLLSDGVSFGIGGLVSRRVAFNSGIGLTLGDVGFAAGRTGARSAQASVGVVTAVSRFVGIGTDYTYYHHRFGEDVVLPPGVGHEIDRQSARVYVSLWAPIFSSTRRLNASR